MDLIDVLLSLLDSYLLLDATGIIQVNEALLPICALTFSPADAKCAKQYLKL